MGCFHMLRDVIVSECAALAPAERAQLQRAVEQLSATYATIERDGEAWEGPDFSDPVMRAAYLYEYVGFNAGMLAKIFADRTALVAPIFDQDHVRVLALGGGPGSDVVGLNKFLEQGAFPACHHLSVALIDRCTEWGLVWTEVFMEGIDESPLRITANSAVCDVTAPSAVRYAAKLAGVDLITSLFLLSELFPKHEAAHPFLEALLAACPKGTMWFYLDNDRSAMHAWFDALLTRHGWAIMDRGSGRQRLPWTNEPGAEEKDVLTELGLPVTHVPRVNGKVTWAFARKEAL